MGFHTAYFTDPIHERGLIKHIHRSSLEEGTGPFDFDIGFVHLEAGFLNHFNTVTDITTKRDESALHLRCFLSVGHVDI